MSTTERALREAILFLAREIDELWSGSHTVEQDAEAILANPPSTERQAVPEALLDAVDRLMVYCDESDDARYGTLSVSFVRSLFKDALPPSIERTEPTAKAIEALCNDDPDLSVGEATEILRRGTDTELPPLPRPAFDWAGGVLYPGGLFTADDMQAYARAALSSRAGLPVPDDEPPRD